MKSTAWNVIVPEAVDVDVSVAASSVVLVAPSR